MFKFAVLSVLAVVASVSGAPGNLVVPVVASPAAIAVAHPVQVATATSYSNTYRAPVVKALPLVKTVPVVAAAPSHQLVHATPVVAAPLVAAHPVVKTTHQVVAHPAPAIVKTAPLVAHAAPIAVAHPPLVHTAPIPALHGLPITGYATHYKVAPLVKTGVVAAPVALVH
ncbi:calphotin-like [Venturia canescens]|uniref:calphotin-like n=1 Tax=Venturia canescens TaxID=32260 RepID=UPI001C9C2BCC|nr:calphotin-like [Venturia canescens]